MSHHRALICKECYEERDLEGSFASRMEFNLVVLGICDVCYLRSFCVYVTAEEALSLSRSERMLTLSVLIAIGIAALLVAGYFFAKEECRAAGESIGHCVIKCFSQ
jgi:hypothetical protein